MRVYPITVLAVLALGIGAGCGSPEGPELPVTGRVTLDGTPLADGEVTFEAADGRDRSYYGRIEAGEFSFESTVGLKRVRISQLERVDDPDGVPGTPGDPVGPENPAFRMEERIPARYNVQSELEVEVTQGGPNEFTFDLTSDASS